jgi:predicted RNase H-like nuclease
MVHVAGLDGTPDGWAAVSSKDGVLHVKKLDVLSGLFDVATQFDIVAIDIPIGLLDAYEAGGRTCDREARRLLRKRASSVFPAPVRCVLGASTYDEACELSRASAPNGKAITKQTFAIRKKIEEVDRLLRTRRELRDVVREVHPEVSFLELTGDLMAHSKRKREGREDRKQALRQCFPGIDAILDKGHGEGLPLVDILDAAVACWSAVRLAEGKGRSLVNPIPCDAMELPMTIWV